MTATASPISEKVEQLWPSLKDSSKLTLAFHHAALDHVRASCKPVGHDETGVPFYAFRWLGDAWKREYRRTITGPVVFEPRRPGRFAPMKGSGVEVVTSFLECGDAFGKLPDEAVWTAAEKACNELMTLSGEDARRFAEAVGLSLAWRAGIDPSPTSLWVLTEEAR